MAVVLKKLTLLLSWLWLCGHLSCDRLNGLTLPLDGEEFILKAARTQFNLKTCTGLERVSPLRVKGESRFHSPVEIQQLIGNLGPDAPGVNHRAGRGGDAWYNWKRLLAIFWQRRVKGMCTRFITHHIIYSVSDLVFVFFYLLGRTFRSLGITWLFRLVSWSTGSTVILPFAKRAREREREALIHFSNSVQRNPGQAQRERSVYSRYNCVSRHNVFYFFGPGIYKTKPLALQSDKRAVFCFELVAVCLYFLFTAQHWGGRNTRGWVTGGKYGAEIKMKICY